MSRVQTLSNRVMQWKSRARVAEREVKRLQAQHANDTRKLVAAGDTKAMPHATREAVEACADAYSALTRQDDLGPDTSEAAVDAARGHLATFLAARAHMTPPDSRSLSDHSACQAAVQAIYDAAVEAMEDTAGLMLPRQAFEYRLGTAGHVYHREGIADLIRERDRLRAQVETLDGFRNEVFDALEGRPVPDQGAGNAIATMRHALEETTGAFSVWSGARRDAMKYGGSSAQEYDRLVRVMIAAREALNGGEDA